MYNMYAATKRHCSDLPPILSPNTCFQNTNTLPIEMAQIVPGERGIIPVLWPYVLLYCRGIMQ